MRQELVSGAPMHSVELNFIDGNLWQLRDLKEEEPRGGIWVQRKSGLHNWVSTGASLGSGPTAGQAAQRDSDKLVRGFSRAGLVPGILMNETIAFRQRGHGMEPGGPDAVKATFVEQR